MSLPGALKVQVGLLENASPEMESMKLRDSLGWKMQVAVRSDGKCKYGKYKYLFAGPTMQLTSINKLNW